MITYAQIGSRIRFYAVDGFPEEAFIPLTYKLDIFPLSRLSYNFTSEYRLCPLAIEGRSFNPALSYRKEEEGWVSQKSCIIPDCCKEDPVGLSYLACNGT